METQTKNQNQLILRWVNAILALSALMLVYYFTDLFLGANFDDNGEAYRKGAGHILEENFFLGLIFLSTRHLFTLQLFRMSCFG